MTEFQRAIKEQVAEAARRKALEYLIEINRDGEYRELLDHIRNNRHAEANTMAFYWLYKSTRSTGNGSTKAC